MVTTPPIAHPLEKGYLRQSLYYGIIVHNEKTIMVTDLRHDLAQRFGGRGNGTTISLR